MWPLKKTNSKLIQDRETIRRLSQMVSEFTPDIGFLEENQRHLIFVFDDMMSGKSNSDMIVEYSLTGRWPLAHVYTEDRFHFWRKELGNRSYPIALEKAVSGYTEFRYDREPAKIWGELFAVRSEAFIKLDIERENGVQYTRRRVQVRLPYVHSNPVPDIKDAYFWPWMYIGIHEYWDDQLAGIISSHPVDRTPDSRSWLGPHYRFK